MKHDDSMYVVMKHGKKCSTTCGPDTLPSLVAWRGFSTFGRRTDDGHNSVTIAPAVEPC
jgi:hypothetical protein